MSATSFRTRPKRELSQFEIDNRLYHEIHVSQIREYKKCSWSHDWKYVDQLYPKTVAKPLEFGTAMHLGLEYMFDPKFSDVPTTELVTLAKSAFITECKKQRDNVPQFAFASKEEINNEYAERIDLGKRMLDYYANVIRPVIDKDLEPLYVEKNFVVPIDDDSKCYCDQCYKRWSAVKTVQADDHFTGLTVVLEGKIDLVLRDKKTGKVWIRDWKNVATISNDYEWLELDEQLNNYLLALWLLNLDVAGFQYFELKKAIPAPPNVLKSRRMGRILSTDKNQDTTFELFVEKLDELGESYGLYLDYLTFLKERGMDHYYKLNKIRKTDKALEVQLKNLQAVISEMINDPKAYPTPTKFGCKFCEFTEPCIERMNGNDPKPLLQVLFDKKPHYYEVRDGEKKYSL